MTTPSPSIDPHPAARSRRRPRNPRKATPAVRPLAHSPARAAELLNISPSQVAIEIKTGRLRARRRGRTVLILDADLIEYVNSLPRWEK
jgi:excisionase family DNA binding protein